MRIANTWLVINELNLAATISASLYYRLGLHETDEQRGRRPDLFTRQYGVCHTFDSNAPRLDSGQLPSQNGSTAAATTWKNFIEPSYPASQAMCQFDHNLQRPRWKLHKFAYFKHRRNSDALFESIENRNLQPYRRSPIQAGTTRKQARNSE